MGVYVALFYYYYYFSLSLFFYFLSYFGGKSLKSKCLLTGGCITRYFFSAFILMELLARGRSCPWLSVLYHEFL